MRHIRVAGLAAVLVWSGSSYAQRPTGAAAVRQTVAGFAATWNRHDMPAFGRLFAPDAFDSIDVRFVRPDVAIARVAWRLMGDARTAAARTGLLLFVVVRNGDEWQIAAAQNTEIQRTVH